MVAKESDDIIRGPGTVFCLGMLKKGVVRNHRQPPSLGGEHFSQLGIGFQYICLTNSLIYQWQNQGVAVISYYPLTYPFKIT